MNEQGPARSLKVLYLTTHLDVGGISSYLFMLGKRLMADGYTVAVGSSGGAREDQFKKIGFTVCTWPIRTKNEFHPKLFWCLPRVIRWVRREKVDLIHAQSRVTQVLAFWVSLFTGVPTLSTCHGFYKRRLGRRWLPAWGTKVIAISPIVADELQKTHRVPYADIRMIWNAMDVEDFRRSVLSQNPAQIRRNLGIPDHAYVIGCVARLVKDKGQEDLIRAMVLARKKHPECFLLLVGDGRERKNIEKLIRRCHLESCARLLVSSQDTAAIFSILDLFVHPAQFREGFGLTILEAMVSKVPVIATNIWAVNAVIQNYIHGILVEPKNVDALTQALCFAIENPERLQPMVENAFVMARKSYDMDRLAREVETVYREVLKI